MIPTSLPPINLTALMRRFPQGTGPAMGTAGRGTTAAVAPPNDLAAASRAVQNLYDPLVNEIKNAELATSNQGQSLINGYTTNAMNQLKGIDFGAPYAGAAGSENAINTALLASLKGQGSALQDQLGSQLGPINAPDTAARITGQIGTNALGAGNAALATGDASLSALNNAGAAAKTYGEKLPGITSLAGLQDTSKLQGQVNADEAKQLGDVQAKVPAAVAAAATSIQSGRLKQEGIDATTRNNDIKTIIATNLAPDGKSLTPQGIAQLKALGVTATGTTAQGASIAARASDNAASRAQKAGEFVVNTGLKKTAEGIAQQNADTSASRAATAASQGAAKIQFGYDKLNAADKIAYAKVAQGNAKLALQAAAADRKATTMSPDAYSKLLQTASKKADDFYNGVAPVVSSSGIQVKPGVPPVAYGPALSQLLAEGVKLHDAFDILNARYGEGEGGRPFTTSSSAKAAAVKSYPKATG